MTHGSFRNMTMADGAGIAVWHVPAQGARRGGLVVVQEIFGVNAHIRAVAEGFAADGYEVLAPQLFDREAPGFETGYDAAGVAEGVRLSRDVHPIETSLADVQTCVDALDGPVFVTGYCYGGSIAWLAAQRLRGIAAASCYYGRLAPDTAAVAPKCPAILHFGRHDAGIPLDGVQKLIDAGHADAEVFLYDAGHGFNCDQRADYDAASAALARARTLALFRAHGG